jgi:hypothetical protein
MQSLPNRITVIGFGILAALALGFLFGRIWQMN